MEFYQWFKWTIMKGKSYDRFTHISIWDTVNIQISIYGVVHNCCDGDAKRKIVCFVS